MPEVIHRAAAPLAVLVLDTVEDTQDVLGEIRHHSEECHHPHPEHCARSARDYCGGDAGDITRADRGRKRRTDTLELGNLLVLGVLCNAPVLEYSTDGAPEPAPDMGHLEALGQHSHENSHKEQEYQRRPAPDNAAYCIVDSSHSGKECVFLRRSRLSRC